MRGFGHLKHRQARVLFPELEETRGRVVPLGIFGPDGILVFHWEPNQFERTFLM